MFVYTLLCLLAGAMAIPVQPHVDQASHIVIVTPQAQVHLEPALRYVHNLQPVAPVASAAHRQDVLVYVPAAPLHPVEAVSSVGRSSAAAAPALLSAAPAIKQIEQISQNIEQIQQQVQQGAEAWGGQFSEASNAAAAAAAAAGSGFFPSFYPPASATGIKKEEPKIELIETPANTQPLLPAAEARHFYTLPQVYHTPVVDVVHGPLYLAPLSAIRARSLLLGGAEEGKEQQAALPLSQPLLEEKKELLEESQPLIAAPPAAAEPIIEEKKAELAGRLLDGNAEKQELQPALEQEQPLKEEQQPKPIAEPLIKAIPAEEEENLPAPTLQKEA